MKTALFTLVALFLVVGRGNGSIDGTVLADGRKPDRPFSKAFAEAIKALRNAAPKSFCYRVLPITPAAGGGWDFYFFTAPSKSFAIHIRRNGTNKSEPTSGDGNAIPPAPTLPLLDAVGVADTAIQKRLKGFFFTGAEWVEKDDTWIASFTNSVASRVCVWVTPTREARVGDVNRRNR